MVYDVANILSNDKKDAIDVFLKIARDLSENNSLNNTCNLSLTYPNNIFCLNDSSTQQVFANHHLFAKQSSAKKKSFFLQTSIILEDAFCAKTKQMRTDLLQQKVLPLSQPYHIAPWNYKGNEKLPSYLSLIHI